MEMADDKWKRQVDYLISMALMKEMRDEGIISKDSLIVAEEVIASEFKPYCRYKDKALGLIYSKWSNDKSNLYWGLTTKGEIERNKMILVAKTNVDG